MLNISLYLAVLIAWGGSWLAIKWQLGTVLPEVSILYRFLLASVIMMGVMVASKRLQPTTRNDQLFCALQGLCLFSVNFICFYQASHYIASGLVAVVMSTVTLFNAANSRLFWRTAPDRRFSIGAPLGIAGLVLLFWSDLQAQQWSLHSLQGIGYALLGTLCFSLGNMITVRHSKVGLHPMTTTSWAMLYGCVALLLVIAMHLLLAGQTVQSLVFWDAQPRYLGGLLYLAIVATVIGFTTYLMLVSRIGANNAAYALVVTPVIALSLSSVFEGYQWTHSSLLGLVLIMAGNLVVMGVAPRFMQRLQLAAK